MSFACALASQITLSSLEKDEREQDVVAKALERRAGWTYWHLAVYVLAVPVLVLYTLVLCSSFPHLEPLHLAQLTSSGLDGSPILRIGYFAICATLDGDRLCIPTPGKSAALLSERLAAHFNFNTDSIDTLQSLASIALTLQHQHLLPLPAATGLLFLCSLLPFALLHRWPRAPHLRLTTTILTWTSTALLTAATLSTVQTTSALVYATTSAVQQPSIRITAGTTLLALLWTLVGLSVLCSILMTTTLYAAHLTNPAPPKVKNTTYSTFLAPTSTPPPPPPPPEQCRRHIRTPPPPIPPPPTRLPIHASYTNSGDHAHLDIFPAAAAGAEEKRGEDARATARYPFWKTVTRPCSKAFDVEGKEV